MDTEKTPEEIAAKVAADLQRIKSHMPGVYAAIQQKASVIGGKAYALVRAGCAGKPNHFWAMENGHIVGTRFQIPELDRDVAHTLVAYGLDCLVVWPESVPAQQQEGATA